MVEQKSYFFETAEEVENILDSNGYNYVGLFITPKSLPEGYPSYDSDGSSAPLGSIKKTEEGFFVSVHYGVLVPERNEVFRAERNKLESLLTKAAELRVTNFRRQKETKHETGVEE